MIKKQFKILTGCLLLAALTTQFSCGTLRQIELNSNRRLWRESKITNYRMTVDLQKTGHATPMGKFIITVRGGVAESIKLANNPEVDLSNSVLKFGGYETIEDIFDYIESTENKSRSWDKREIEYDSKLGYPKKVNLDKSGVLDDELFFQVLQFEVLE
ncbi:MAG: hypothetical protein H0W58_10815 [Acidobacteria bacterium]|nr:hypothetical protein [Acidobacteriota bacterium]